MKDRKRILMIEQIDAKLSHFNQAKSVVIPSSGWVKSVRSALNMSLRQLAKRLNISSQSISEMEKREANGTITLNTLKELARALDMQLVYGFVPNQGSIDQMIEQRAQEIAKEVVGRTHVTMTLEDQQISDEKISKVIAHKSNEIKNEIPKYLWD